MSQDEPTVFDDAEAYERFMARWTRAVGEAFLEWLAPVEGTTWLDVGCGTGIFTQLILDTCTPAAVHAIDPAKAQVEYARKQSVARLADFRVADAVALPFLDATFDVVVSALVLNFIPDRHRALSEMRRVARPGATVAAYVWDFAEDRSTSWPLNHGLRQIGADVPKTAGTDESSIQALTLLFRQAGFEGNTARSFEVAIEYSTFEDYWRCQVPPFSMQGRTIAALAEEDRNRLIDAVRSGLPAAPDGSLSYCARANAIKGVVPE